MTTKLSSGPLTMTLSLAETELPQGGTISGEILVEVRGTEPYFFRSLFLDFDGTESNSVKDDQGEFDQFLNDFTSTRTYLHRRATPAGLRDADREDAEAAEQLRLELLFREHHKAPYARAVPWKPTKPSKSAETKPSKTAPPPKDPEAAEAAGNTAAASPPTPTFSPQEGGEPASVEPVACETQGGPDTHPSSAVMHNEEEGGYADMPRDRFYPGRYSFPFTFKIPPWMPPSLYYRAGHTAYGEIRYRVVATLDVPGPATNPRLELTFFVLSTLSKRQLLGARQEAVDTATIAPLPPLSAQLQVFRCEWLGNFCCLDNKSIVEVEVALQCSRALLLTDPHGHVDKALQEEKSLAVQPPQQDGYDAITKAYDAFAQRRPIGAVDARRGDGPLESEDSHSAGAALPSDPNQQEARRAILESLPPPVGVLPLLVRVDNQCPDREISRVRVELREVIRFFKALEPPHTFCHPLARFDYTMRIPPLHEATFPVSLSLPAQFRRCRADSATLLPPPGVRTANFATQTLIVIGFPELHVYTEEEDWTVGAVHLAEALDLTDSVLEIPVSYS